MKPIILIQGAAGTGKTTLANELVKKYNINHRLGTGYIREIIKSETTEKDDPFMFSHTFQAEDPIEHIQKQSKRLEKAILSCIDRARREGQSLVIEGNHMFPERFHNVNVDAYFVLTHSNKQEHFRRANDTTTHEKRMVTPKEFANIRKIDQFLIAEAKKYNIPVIDHHSMEDTLAQVELLLLKQKRN